MPWCEQCARFYTPSTLTSDGDCPSGHHVADPALPGPSAPSDAAGPTETDVADRVRAPWHFWLLVAALAAYLGWRLVQGVVWLFT